MHLPVAWNIGGAHVKVAVLDWIRRPPARPVMVFMVFVVLQHRCVLLPSCSSGLKRMLSALSAAL